MSDIYSDDELSRLVTEIFIDGGPFTKSLGVGVDSRNGDRVRLSFEMRDGFVGLTRNPMLHGGVVASVIDVAGGIAVFLSAIRRMKNPSLEERAGRVERLNTIDLRIDYLRPGVGNRFYADGYIIRTGSKVAVARMEMHNDEQQMLALGTGSYMIFVK